MWPEAEIAVWAQRGDDYARMAGEALAEIARLREALEKVERHAQTMYAAQRDREPRWDHSYRIMAQQVERLARAALSPEAKP